MGCGYDKYINDLLDGSLNKEKETELLEHAKSCSECSLKLDEINRIDRSIKYELEDFSNRSISDKVMARLDEERTINPISSIFYRYRSIFYPLIALLVLAVSIYSYSLFKASENPKSPDKGPGSQSIAVPANDDQPSIFTLGKDGPNIREEYMNFIKSNLKLGLSKEQVIKLLGSNYTEVTGADSNEYGKYFFKYDLLAEDGYRYYNELDGLDIDGLTLGKVKIILSIAFNRDYKLQSYSYYYYDAINECIKDYYVLEDGTIKEERVASKSPNVGKVDILPLSQELLDVYDKYSKNPDDQLLIGLGPLDIFRLYFYAKDKKDYNTAYELIAKGRNYLVPSKEEFLGEVSNDKAGQANDEKLLNELKNNIHNVYILDNSNYKDSPEEAADIQINFEKETLWGNSIAFALVKDDKGIWKVRFLAMQS